MGPGHLLDSPPARKMDFSLSSHLWRDADAVSSPGLAFSSLTPESYDLATDDLYSREQSSQGLTQEEPQVHVFLLTSHSPSPFSSPWKVPGQGLEVSTGQAEGKERPGAEEAAFVHTHASCRWGAVLVGLGLPQEGPLGSD